jgi:hypothetical protein
MPLQDWNLESTWQNAYRLKKASDPNAWADGYVRDSSCYPAAAWQAGMIVNALNIQASSTVGIIGAGFGWIANNIALITGCVVAAVDTSTYIQDRKIDNADIEIINADVSANNGRTQVKQALGITGNNKASFMITELVLECLSDAECTQLSTFLHNLTDTVVHIVALRDDAKQASGHQDATGWNWKSAAEWKALLPNDVFIQAGTWVVL